MKNKVIILVILLVCFLSVFIYLNKGSSYQKVTNNSSKNNISLEDQAIDEKIKEQRKKNEKTYYESGISGDFTSGEGYAPKRERNDFVGILEGVKFYINNHSDIYPEYDEFGREYSVGVSTDPRFESLLWKHSKEDRKGLIEGYDDEDMIVMEAKRLDGEYDDLLLLKNKSGIWEVKFVGNYYELKNMVK